MDLNIISEVLGPFVIIFTITYAMTLRIKILDNKSFGTVISFIIAVLFVAPHMTGVGPDYVPTLNIMAPSIAFILVMLLSFILLSAMIGIKTDKDFFLSILTVLIIVDLIIPDTLIIAWIFRSFGTEVPSWLDFLQSEWFLSVAIIITVVGGVIAFVAADAKD